MALQASGLDRHMAMVDWLKAEHAMGHGHANALVAHYRAHGTDAGAPDVSTGGRGPRGQAREVSRPPMPSALRASARCGATATKQMSGESSGPPGEKAFRS